jgi:hypothetical protein
MSLQYAIVVGAAPRGGPIRAFAILSIVLSVLTPAGARDTTPASARDMTPENARDTMPENAQTGAPAATANAPASGASPAVSIEAEVLGNIRAQTIGPATVADLPLPDDFLRRVADRIVRSSYEERFRIVVSAEHAHPPPADSDAMDASETDAEPPIATWQVLMWICIAGFVAVFAGLVWKGRRKVSA